MNESCQPRILRLAEVMQRTGYRRASVYAKNCPSSRQFDPSFPRRICLSPTGRGAVGWLESEILAWLQARVDACRGQSTTKTVRSAQEISIEMKEAPQ